MNARCAVSAEPARREVIVDHPGKYPQRVTSILPNVYSNVHEETADRIHCAATGMAALQAFAQPILSTDYHRQSSESRGHPAAPAAPASDS